jgi:hypothetical protein
MEEFTHRKDLTGLYDLLLRATDDAQREFIKTQIIVEKEKEPPTCPVVCVRRVMPQPTFMKCRFETTDPLSADPLLRLCGFDLPDCDACPNWDHLDGHSKPQSPLKRGWLIWRLGSNALTRFGER